MDTFGAMEVSRSADFQIALVFVLLIFGAIYPSWIVYKRHRFQKRISQSVVTSMYKLAVDMTPSEMAYIFSAHVGKRHLYATLHDLAYRGVITLERRKNTYIVDEGPKIKSTLKSYEKLLVGQVHIAGKAINIDRVVEGFTNYSLSSGEKIRGSREYVYWWLLRHTMRSDNRIYRNMIPRYSKLLFTTGVLLSLPIVLIPLMAIRIVQAIGSGEVLIVGLIENFVNGVTFWLLALVPLIIASFFLLRYKGLMLGREWLLKSPFDHYLEQLDAYRAFVKLTHSGGLRFESKELQRESKTQTMPYAIALGYVNWDD